MNMMRIVQTFICIAIIVSSCKQGNEKLIQENKTTIQKDTSQWVSLMIAGYQKFNEEPTVAAADRILEATELMPYKNLENYLVCAMVYAQLQENEKAFKAIERAISEGFIDSDLLNSIPEYASLRDDARWVTLISQSNRQRSNYEESIQNKQLLEVLKNLWAEDQKALAQYEENAQKLDSTATNADYRELFIAVEKRWDINKTKLDSIIAIHGWPGNTLVGKEGAKVAWGIPQHHPDVFFKEKCLSLLKQALDKREVDPNHYAQLYDRIARETWQKQTFGTSMNGSTPFPIQDPAHVNRRRSEIGLNEPMEVHAIYHGVPYATPTTADIQLIHKNAQVQYTKFKNAIHAKKIDSANTYIATAISAHGDISNEQLYHASTQLAQIDHTRSKRICLNILKVLIWRKWEGRFKILDQGEFNILHHKPQWEEIERLLKLSANT